MKIKILLSLFVICVCSCASTIPSLLQLPAGDGTMNFFPATNWKGSNSVNLAKVDITYITERNQPAAINISFFGKKTTPRKVSSVFLKGEGIVYPLTIMKTLYANSRNRELRISTEGDRNLLPNLLKAPPFTLIAEIDGVQYTFTPEKNFSILVDDFLVIF